MELVLTARSGKHAFSYITKKLGYKIAEEIMPEVYTRFLKMADQKKEIYDSDVIALLDSCGGVINESAHDIWKLEDFQVVMNSSMPTATVKLSKEEEVVKSSTGEGAIDALYSAIIEAVQMPIKLIDYRIHSLSQGKKSMGKVSVQIEWQDKVFAGKAIEQDVIKASAIALINAINKTTFEALYRQEEFK